MKVCIVLSTRPEIIKLSPLISIFKKKKVNFFIINTNQHYSKRMSRVFFNFFKVPKPKYNLKANSKSHKIFFSKAINNIEKILNKEKPNILIVQGDTNTALAGCKAASNFNAKLKKNEYKIKIAHVEAGLRSFDKKLSVSTNIHLQSNELAISADATLSPGPNSMMVLPCILSLKLQQSR